MFTQMNLFDEVALRILAAMAEHPEAEFYQREVASCARVSSGSASQKLRKLCESELVSCRRSGRMMFYHYNLGNLVSRQFKILFNLNSVQSLVHQLREHSRRIILFGSCAEGTNAKDSDIDLFVLCDNASRVRDLASAYTERLGRKVSAICVTPEEFQQLRIRDRPLYKRVTGGIILWQSP